MKRRIMRMLIGITIASLGIACLLNSSLGCFAVTAAYKAISGWFNIPLAVVNIIIEIIMIYTATKLGEGLGLTAIVNATYGAIMINIFHNVLPHNTILALGVFLLPIGWSIIGRAGFGDTGTNILMRAIMKNTGLSVRISRLLVDCTFLIIASFGAQNYVTLFTIVLTFFYGPLLQIIYNLMGYKPAEVEHEFLITSKH